MNPTSYLGPAICSLLVAIVLQLVPVSGDWLLWKPNFLLLVVIAWILYEPNHFGVGSAALVGLLCDALYRTNLGHYVLVFAICGSIAYLLSRWLTYFSIFHRAFLVFLLVIAAELLQALLFSFWDIPMRLQHVPALALTSALVWVPVDKLIAMMHFHQR